MESTVEASDQLGLGLGGELVMHATQRTFLGAERVIGLDHVGGKPVVRKLSYAEGPRKKTAIVAALFQID